MSTYSLSSGFRMALGFCYKSTFFLMAVYLAFFLVIVFAMTQDWLEQASQIIEIGAYIVGSLMAICIIAMASYALGYVWHLWQGGHRKEAVQGLITFVFLNILTGYIWFYLSEVKNKEIRFKLV